jgi:hypothetical protein
LLSARAQEHVRKPDYIANLERRQKALEEEITNAVVYCSDDDPMIADLKRRMLHLKEELKRFHHLATTGKRMH